ncbi:hypothetical protein H2200_012954 [Cladophialophora chaetospira]|uniref:Uncharacterized protein n=1 Tax=Cladophialophora chaetospira TaxID=386627 RepID=A0AA38WWI2_9EURO|nr:hypothetical protein H2200_012954 [Cladophialophora chaetospira]
MGDSHRAGMTPLTRSSRPSTLVASYGPFWAWLAQHGLGFLNVSRRKSFWQMFGSLAFVSIGLLGGATGSSSMDGLSEVELDVAGSECSKADVDETSRGDVPHLVVLRFLLASVHGGNTPVSAFLAGLAQSDVVIADGAPTDAGEIAEFIAKSVCGGMVADEEIPLSGAHFDDYRE